MNMDAGSKRLVTGGLLAGGAMVVMAATVIGAGIAKADPNGMSPWTGPMGDHSAPAYWVDISKFADGTVDDARTLATSICTALDNQSEGNLVATMTDGVQHKIDTVTFIVHGAEWHFCPEYY